MGTVELPRAFWRRARCRAWQAGKDFGFAPDRPWDRMRRGDFVSASFGQRRLLRGERRPKRCELWRGLPLIAVAAFSSLTVRVAGLL
jgi:hypothetical protein